MVKPSSPASGGGSLERSQALRELRLLRGHRGALEAALRCLEAVAAPLAAGLVMHQMSSASTNMTQLIHTMNLSLILHLQFFNMYYYLFAGIY